MGNLRLPDLLNADAIDDVFRGFLRPMRWDLSAQSPQIKIEVKENDTAYTVKAEIPGVRKEDIDVRIDGSQVSLSAETKKEKEEKTEHTLRSERYYGYLNRTFTLGHEIDQGKAAAKYEDGVLQLTLPKKAGTENKRLAIA